MLEDLCEKLHRYVNNLPRYDYLVKKEDICSNGIYFFFEKNEKAHNVDRIVRIGTDTGENNLYKRIVEHFIKENKDRSIFRKNIGRAILNKRNDKFLKYWEMDLTAKDKRSKLDITLDEYNSRRIEIEKEVSDYMKNNLTFTCIEVNGKENRLYYEEKLISLVSLCKSCKASDKWLGNYSPIQKIRESGLWLVQGLYKEPIKEEELINLMV